MTLPRVLSAVGRTLAILGVIMLLFVAFELWGTGIQQAQAQGTLESEFAERFRQAAAAGQGVASPQGLSGPSASTTPGPAPDPAIAEAATDPGEGGGGPAPARDRDGERPAANRAATGRDGAILADGDPDGDADPRDAASQITPPGPPEPVPLPEYPSLPRVVRAISEAANARTTSRLLDPEVEALLPLVYPSGGEAIARIIIPAIGLDEIVVAGIEVEDLRKGPGHYDNTPLPGQPGNAAIAGHRTTYGAPFGEIAELAPGDEIIVETLQGRFVYRVQPGSAVAGRSLGHRIVAPTALEVLDDYGDNRLTLTSCHPKYSSRERIIVQATLVGDPVVRLPRPGEPIGTGFVQLAAAGEPPAADTGTTDPDARAPGGRDAPDPDDAEATGASIGEDPVPATAGSAGEADRATPGDPAPGTADAPEPRTATANSTPRAAPPPPEPVTSEGFGEGLSGDRGAIVPAVLWGLAAIAVWALGWAFGRSGRRLRAYAIAAVPFLVVLYITFSYIDRALPAY